MNTNTSFNPDDFRIAHGISHAAALDVLRRIATGAITLRLEKPEWTWEKVYAGHVTYEADGWKIVVFNNCDEFDYIEYMRTPTGQEGDFHGFRENGARAPEDTLKDKEPELYESMTRAFIEAR